MFSNNMRSSSLRPETLWLAGGFNATARFGELLQFTLSRLREESLGIPRNSGVDVIVNRCKYSVQPQPDEQVVAGSVGAVPSNGTPPKRPMRVPYRSPLGHSTDIRIRRPFERPDVDRCGRSVRISDATRGVNARWRQHIDPPVRGEERLLLVAKTPRRGFWRRFWIMIIVRMLHLWDPPPADLPPSPPFPTVHFGHRNSPH